MANYSYTSAETLTATDVGTALEFFAEFVGITGESLSTAFRFVGHSGTGYGWKLKDVFQLIYSDLAAGETWTFVLEDYLENATVNNLVLRLQNPEGKQLAARVTETVRGLGTFTLLSESFVGKAYIDVPLFPRLLSPIRQKDTITKTYHTVTVTNNEATSDAMASAAIAGWVTWPTTIPAVGPSYP